MGFGPRFEIPHSFDGRDVTVTMRPAQSGDATEMAWLVSDLAVQQFILIQGGMSPKDEEEFFERARTSPDQTLWVIGVRSDDGNETLSE